MAESDSSSSPGGHRTSLIPNVAVGRGSVASPVLPLLLSGPLGRPGGLQGHPPRRGSTSSVPQVFAWPLAPETNNGQQHGPARPCHRARCPCGLRHSAGGSAWLAPHPGAPCQAAPTLPRGSRSPVRAWGHSERLMGGTTTARTARAPLRAPRNRTDRTGPGCRWAGPRPPGSHGGRARPGPPLIG